jgi:hypothetical protein
MRLQNGVWLLPLRERLEGTARLLASVQLCDPYARIVAIIDNDDPMRDTLYEMCRAATCRIVLVSENLSTGEKLNIAFCAYPSEGFYGFLANDIELRTPGALSALAEAVPYCGLSYCNDSLHEDRLATHPCVSGDLVRLLNWWAFPELHHNGIDLILMDCAHAGGGCKYLSEYFLYHFHPSQGRAQSDSVSARVAQWAEQDMKGYAAWTLHGLRESTMRRIREHMENLHVES